MSVIVSAERRTRDRRLKAMTHSRVFISTQAWPDSFSTWQYGSCPVACSVEGWWQPSGGWRRTVRRGGRILATDGSNKLWRKMDDSSAVGNSRSGNVDAKCRIHFVESIPQNVTFPSGQWYSSNKHSAAPDSISTFKSWVDLIDGAKESLLIAPYKSSLRGVHVFGSMPQSFSAEGEEIYESLVRAGLEKGVQIRMVENGPSKDKGDNADGKLLAARRVLAHRTLNFARLQHAGIMHSKFIIADQRHFYLGSANLDWRSLNQKMEMGVLARDCPSLASDLASVFESYWQAATVTNKSTLHGMIQRLPPVKLTADIPVGVKSGTGGVKGQVYLAASPPFMNQPSREWDLDAILGLIRRAKTHIYINVMDYFPVFLYSDRYSEAEEGQGDGVRQYWPKIDDALRAAILRGVDMRIITAAIHHPQLGMRFMRSLQGLSGVDNHTGRVEVKIFKVPSPRHLPRLVRRDRRTHKKLLVTDNELLIGTSNWSGDYFEDRAAIVIREEDGYQEEGLVGQARAIFERDWQSDYAYPLGVYYETCLEGRAGVSAVYGNICEDEKDLSLLVSKQSESRE